MIPSFFFEEMHKLSKVRTSLQPHQQRVVDRIQAQSGLVVAHGLGSGKTLSSIAAGELGGGVAVVPASLQENYLKEQAKHLTGAAKVRVMSLQKAVSSGNVPSSPMLIVDEAHRARNPSSQTYKVLKNTKATKRLMLTASPMYNAPEDIASVVNLAAGEKVLPEGRAFRQEYIAGPPKGIWGMMPWARKRDALVRTGSLKPVLEKWVDFHPSSGADFPSKVETRVKVPMTRRQTDLHDAAWGQLSWLSKMRLRQGLPPGKEDLAKINQFQSQARQIGGSETRFGGEETSPKVLEAVNSVAQRIQKDGTHKALVYSNYLDTLDSYAGELKKRNISHGTFTGKVSKKEKKRMIVDFNKGKIKALLVSSAGGEGLDLKGTRQVQVLEPHWNDEKIEQVIGRAARHGSHRHLPEDKRNVYVQKFEAVPLSRRIGVEQVLAERSEHKRLLKQDLLRLLKRKKPPQ